MFTLLVGLLATSPAFTDLAAGGDHTCALRADGRVACWGRNGDGQLGDGTTEDRPRAVWVAGLTDAVEIDAGNRSTCARRKNGQVTCWGACEAPDCPPEAGTRRTVAGLSDARDIALADHFGCAARAGGELACWGSVPGAEGHAAARPVAGPRDVAGMAAGHEFLCAWTKDGAVWCLGKRTWESVEGVDPQAPSETATPVRLARLNGVRALAADWTSLCAAGPDGVRCFDEPAATALPADVPQVEVGLFHKCARLADGEVRCWGSRAPDARGGWVETPAPVSVPGAGPALDVAVGTGHACALRRDGGIVCWGENAEGQLGDGRPLVRPVPARVDGVRDAIALGAGSSLTCALGRDGRARCWGDATCADPQPVEFPAGDLKAFDTALNVACGLRRDGTLTCRRWERGAGWSDEEVPADLGPLDAFAVSDEHACGLRAGRVRCWGEDEQGQVGADVPDEETTAAVGPPGGVAGLSAGEYHTCARLGSGEVWCWGTLTGFRPQPLRRIEGIATAEEIASGAGHACARLRGGDVACFGDMGYGEQFVDTEKPKTIKGLHGVSGLRGGTHVTCGLRGGKAICFGENGDGQLGDGTRADRAAPVAVKLPGRATAVAVGFRHTCAVDAAGAVFCWGRDHHGQLGDGRVSWCGRPSAVLPPR